MKCFCWRKSLTENIPCILLWHCLNSLSQLRTYLFSIIWDLSSEHHPSLILVHNSSLQWLQPWFHPCSAAVCPALWAGSLHFAACPHLACLRRGWECIPELCSLWENVWRSWEPLLPLPWHSVVPSRVSTELSSWGLKLCYLLLINLLKQEEPGITPRGLMSSQNHLVVKGRAWSAQNGPGSQKYWSQLLPAVERSLRSLSELGPPHLRSVLDGVEIPGGSSWISCMACAPQPLPARLREVNPSRQPR